MSSNVKKIMCLFIGSLLLVTTQVCCDKNDEILWDEYEPKSCCNPSNYRKSCPNDKKVEALLRGDLLYWQGTLCGLEGAFGSTSITTEDIPGVKVVTLSQHDTGPDSEWRAGVRLGADILFNCFNLGVDWTHFHGRADYAKCGQCGNWKVEYDVIDFTLGYNFYPCSRFRIKPFIGLRVASIDQCLVSHLQTVRTDLTADPSVQTVLMDVNEKEEFDGIGPLVGGEVGWYLGHSFSLYCMFNIVTYYGDVDGTYNNTDTCTCVIFKNNLSRNRCFRCLGTDGAIGIRWDKYINCKLHFLLKLGLEQHRICDFSDLGADGSLSLDGVVFEAGIGWRF